MENIERDIKFEKAIDEFIEAVEVAHTARTKLNSFWGSIFDSHEARMFINWSTKWAKVETAIRKLRILANTD